MITHTQRKGEERKKMVEVGGRGGASFEEKATINGKQKVDWVDWLACFHYTEAAIIQLCSMISIIIIT